MIEKYLDHTFLKPTVTESDVLNLIEEAKKYQFRGVCVPLKYVSFVKEKLKNTNCKVVTVIGFPLGYYLKEVKIKEAKLALKLMADEVDMVINISDLKEKKYQIIKDEINEIKTLLNDKVLKVIVETCYLTEEEKIKCCQIINETNADYIKTSTGFGIDNAKIEDIKLFKKYLNKGKKIKASGGIKNYLDALKMIKAGADIIGTSSSVKITKESMVVEN
ncbi:deoxyribose-phosphate aldolase [symbiont of Argiope bruennichi]|uniref:deoxyribose-phosphate aldolase n=1 Tax=symbiont of Argiope bruennichi TaxID=2810479 RepID=UPI003DA44EA8